MKKNLLGELTSLHLYTLDQSSLAALAHYLYARRSSNGL